MKRIDSQARALLDAAPDAMIIADSTGTILYANAPAAGLFGYRGHELPGMSIEMLLPERFRSTHRDVRSTYCRNPRLRQMGENRELCALHRRGSEFPVDVRLNTMRTEDGLLVLSTIREIPVRQEAPWEASATRDLARTALNSINDAIISTDRMSKVTYLNPVAEKLTGWALTEAKGKSLDEMLTLIDGNRERIANPLQSVLATQRAAGTTTNRALIRRDGTEIAVEDSAAPMRDEDGEIIGAVMVFRDVGPARTLTAELIHIAQHDALTGLPNRLLLDARLTQALAMARRHSKPLAVLFIDLNKFKQINDSLGHFAGDELLKAVGRRLQQSVRASDTVSRFGGDEFVVLLPEISNREDADVCARKIVNALAAPHAVGSSRIEIGVSVGIGLYPDDGDDPQALLQAADRAMYGEKHKPRQASAPARG